ncbi:porin [Candidatus Pelagibacter ubique]|nr:porin [Candidatus Pelagibacter ubique]
MNNLKKIGLTALAGSLAVTSVYASELTASGSASIGFGGADKGTSANGFYMNDEVTFSGSGELDNGWNVTLSMQLDNDETGTGNMDNRSVTIDMGDAGTFAFGGHGLDSVVGGVDDVMPTAYGETWDIISNTVDNGGVTSTASTLFGAIGSAGDNNMMRYDNTTAVEGLKISASYVPSNGTTEVESSVDYGLEYTGYDGLTLGYAMGENNAAGGTSNTDNDTMYVKYAYGPVTVGYQKSEIDANTATDTDEWTAFGVTYAVSDNLSIGYGESTYDAGSSATDQENTNLSVSYTQGGMTLAAGFAEEENRGGLTTAVNDVKGYDISLAFAF